MTALTAPEPTTGEPPKPLPPLLPAAPPAKFVGLAWSSLILGIVGVVFSPIPIINNLSAMAAVVGLILALIAVFGSRKVLAGIGATLCVLAIVFTIVKQNHDAAALQKAFGNDPTAMSDVAVSNCYISNDYGTPFVHATVKIVNSASRTQSYGSTISVNDASGVRVGEINTFSNALGAGQSTTLSGPSVTGNAEGNAKPGPATCMVASVRRFPS
jgi:hypothetical protein